MTRVLDARCSTEWLRRLSLIESTLATMLAEQNQQPTANPKLRAALWVAHAHSQDTRDELIRLTVAPVAAETLEQV